MSGSRSAFATWAIVLCLSLGPAVSNGFARFAYGLVLPAMREDLAWSYTQAGWINTANALGYLIGALLALATIRRLGAGTLFVGGMILTAIALAGSGLTRDIWVLSGWRVLAGIGSAPVFIAGGAMASATFRGDPGRNALAIAIYFGGGGLGLVISGLTIPLILAADGSGAWPRTWLLLAVASALAVPPSAWAVLRHRTDDAGSVPATASAGLQVGRMLPALAGYVMFGIGYIVYLTFLIAWMRTEGADTQLVVLTWSVLGIAVMLSPFPWRPVLAASRGGGALALAVAATGAGTLLPLVIGGPIGLVLSAALFGLSFFIAPTSVTNFCRKNVDEAQWGTAVALFTVVFALGQMIGPVASGLLVDATDDIAIGLAAAGAILVTGGLIAAAQRPLW